MSWSDSKKIRGSAKETGGPSPFFPKGRQVEPEALEEVRALLDASPHRRDLLIEHLHLIQDRYGHLSARHLTALANEMSLAMTEVYEVATFYAHFDVVMEDEIPPPALTIRVCDSLTCEMMGANEILEGLEKKYKGKVRVVRAPCMGRCETAPVPKSAIITSSTPAPKRWPPPLTAAIPIRSTRPIRITTLTWATADMNC